MNADAKTPVRPGPAVPRSLGRAVIEVERVGARTRLARLHQGGCLKLLMPRGADAGATGILANTSGGLTSGDRLRIEAQAGAGADLTLTTQACERLYRAPEGPASVSVALRAGPDARLSWVPQETIAFDGAALRRRVEADLDPSATLLLCEAVLIGRPAMGERVSDLSLRESWRVRRAGRLVHAEEQALAPEAFASRAGLSGAGALATILLVAPDADARAAVMRGRLAPAGADAAACAWDGKALARILAPDGRALRRLLVPLLSALAPLPRIWMS